MKCSKCGVNYSDRVYRIHTKMCKAGKEPEKTEPVKEVIKSEELTIKPKEYTLDELMQMCIDNPDRTDAPSTIKRWKEDRLKKELGL